MRIYSSDSQHLIFEVDKALKLSVKELPLVLFNEQVCLLKELGVELIDAKNRPPTETELLEYRKYKHDKLVEFIAAKQLYDDLQKENHLSRLGLVIPKPTNPNSQLELETPWFDSQPFDFNWPKTAMDIARFQCYREFYFTGYWITQGLKFGDEPGKVHSKVIVKIIESPDKIDPLDKIVFGRLATSVNKIAKYCWWDFDARKMGVLQLPPWDRHKTPIAFQ